MNDERYPRASGPNHRQTRWYRVGALLVLSLGPLAATGWVIYHYTASAFLAAVIVLALCSLAWLLFRSQISLRRRAETALRTSEVRYRRLFEAAHDGVLLLDGQTHKITAANPFMSQLLGCSRQELLGKELWEIGFLKDAETSRTAFDHLEREGQIRYEDLAVQVKTGQTHTVEFVSNVYDEDGRSVIQCNIRDITQRKRAEEANAWLAAIVENSEDAILSIALDGIVTSWNPAAERLFGYSPAAMLGQSIEGIVPPDRRKEAAIFLERVRAGRHVNQYQTVRIARDGRRIDVVVTLSPVRDRSGRIVGASKLIHDISHRRRADEALRQSQERLTLATLAAKLGTWDWNLLSGELVWSPRCLELFGLSPETVMTYERFLAAIHPEDRDLVDQTVRTAVERHEDYKVEMRSLWPDGSLHWVGSHGRAYYDPAGRPTRMSGIALDVTERVRAEAALRESEERVRMALTAAKLGTWDYDLQTQEVSGDERAREIFGLASCRMEFSQFLGVIPPPDRDRVAGAVRAAISPTGSGHYEMEHRVVWPDRSLHWVAVNGEIHFTGKGPQRRAERFLGTVMDITQRKQAEALLRVSLRTVEQERLRLADTVKARDEALAQLNALLDNAPLGFAFFDRAHRYVKLNEFLAHKLDGLPLEAHLGKPIREVLPVNAQVVDPLLDSIFSSGQALENVVVTGETPASPGEQRHWLTAWFPVRTPDGRVPWVGAVVMEITSQKRTEEELQAARKELGRANAALERKVERRTARLQETVEELESFSYSLVHDMRAPLRAMQTYASVLEEESGPRLSPGALDYIRKIKLATHRMDQLITDSLNYSKIVREELPIAPVHLGRLLRGLLETYPGFQPPAVEILEELGDLVVQGNEAALTQVFSNLLGNAVKFVASGVKPKVRVWAEQIPARDAPEHLPQKPAKVLIWIEDNGIGIPKEGQEKIFGMFQRMHRTEEYPGTGIGLAIVRKSLERIGGQVCLDSELGKGSRFCVQLSLAPQAGGVMGLKDAA